MNNSKKILFVTTSNLSTNPRLLKEIKVAYDRYQLHVIAFNLNNWSQKLDTEISQEFKDIQITYLSATRKSLFVWLFTALAEKIAIWLYPLFKHNLFINALASSRRSLQLYFYLTFQKKQRFDTIVGHNLGALLPIYLWSKKNKKPFIFDVEDYHPGEITTKDSKNKEIKRREYLISSILPHASHVTYASPLIKNNILLLLNENYTLEKHTIINNSFFNDQFIYIEPLNIEKIQFVWFSQYISLSRGLSFIIPKLVKFRKQIRLTLIGEILNPQEFEFFQKYNDFIELVKPISQKELNNYICHFDIGLALELENNNFNRDICLTNKIFAYAQAGLFILASDTQSQKQMLEQYPQLGLIIPQNNSENNALDFIIKNIGIIRKEKSKRFMLGKNLSFENEQYKLLTIWENILN